MPDSFAFKHLSKPHVFKEFNGIVMEFKSAFCDKQHKDKLIYFISLSKINDKKYITNISCSHSKNFTFNPKIYKARLPGQDTATINIFDELSTETSKCMVFNCLSDDRQRKFGELPSTLHLSRVFLYNISRFQLFSWGSYIETQNCDLMIIENSKLISSFKNYVSIMSGALFSSSSLGDVLKQGFTMPHDVYADFRGEWVKDSKENEVFDEDMDAILGDGISNKVKQIKSDYGHKKKFNIDL